MNSNHLQGPHLSLQPERGKFLNLVQSLITRLSNLISNNHNFFVQNNKLDFIIFTKATLALCGERKKKKNRIHLRSKRSPPQQPLKVNTISRSVTIFPFCQGIYKLKTQHTHTRARSNYVSSLKSYHLFPLWHYTVDNFLFLFLFLVMAARYSIEQEYYNLFNGHYGCLEFLLLSLKGLSIILFIFLLDFRIIKRQRHRIQIQKSNVTSITNLSRL